MAGLIYSVLAGVSVTMQNSMNGLMVPYIGAMGAASIGAATQLVLLILYQLIREHRIVSIRSVPKPYYACGLIAAIVVGTIGLCVSRMGSAVTTCCSVSGQMMMSALVDHFGLFGTTKHPFSPRRIPGFVLIIAGVLTINLLGGKGEGSASIAYLALAVGLGACAVIVRTLNFRASQACGSTLGGGMVNSISAMCAGFLFLLVMSRFRIDFKAFAEVPLVYYLSGFFGTACLLCNIAAYGKQNVFYATIFMLIGQVATGIVMDVAVFHLLSLGKCLGIGVILLGVLADKVLSGKE